MNFLLDTNHWSELQRRNPEILSHIDGLPQHATMLMSVVSQAELLVGVELLPNGPRKNELRNFYGNLIRESAAILPITSEVAEQFASLFVRLRRKGKRIETNDIWIAATAFAHDLVLVTDDSHFDFVDGLRVENWIRPQ
jgi:tRNA(fMet)-specific endonuclease VapC